MSTRKWLKDRRRYFRKVLSEEPERENLKKAIAEIDFILEKLKEYDSQSNLSIKKEFARKCFEAGYDCACYHCGPNLEKSPDFEEFYKNYE